MKDWGGNIVGEQSVMNASIKETATDISPNIVNTRYVAQSQEAMDSSRHLPLQAQTNQGKPPRNPLRPNRNIPPKTPACPSTNKGEIYHHMVPRQGIQTDTRLISHPSLGRGATSWPHAMWAWRGGCGDCCRDEEGS